jgi:glycosyltransferase involved in cell wall biosynthesis
MVSNNQEPFTSILITAFNRENYIGAAIESVLSLEYSNYELIVVDDCSVDATFSIAERYSKSDPRVRVFRNETNLGDYNNRNRAASYAKGKYLKYLDSDDLIYPFSLSIMVAAMEKYPEAALGLEESYYQEQVEPFPFIKSSTLIYKTQFLKRGVLNSGPSGAILRTDIFKKLGGFSGTRYIGDTELWLKIACNYPVVFFQPAMVYWRKHANQEMTFEKQNRSSVWWRHELNRRVIFNSKKLLSTDERKMALNKLNRRLLHNIIISAFKNNDLSTSMYLIRNSSMSMRDLIFALSH